MPRQDVTELESILGGCRQVSASVRFVINSIRARGGEMQVHELGDCRLDLHATQFERDLNLQLQRK